MADKSIAHFLVFICLLLIYFIYDQTKYIDNIFDKAEDLQGVLEKQQETINAQRFYIQVLERQLLIEPPSAQSPLYKQPL